MTLEQLIKQWKELLEQDVLPPIQDEYKRKVTAVLL